MKTHKESTFKPLSLRLESLENRDLLSAAPWSAPVDSLDVQAVEVAAAQVEQNAVIDLSNAQLEDSVSFANTGVTNSQFALSWDAIDGAATYSVKINRDGSWIQYSKGLTDTSCVMNGLYSGKTYEIRICAVNENGKLTGEYLQTAFAPVRGVGSVNKFVAGDKLGVSVLGSENATCDIAWYYATPSGDVEITEARSLLKYAPENPQHDVKVVVTGAGLSAGSASETLFVYSGDKTVETTYDAASKTLQVVAPAVDGAVKYYIWKPAPSGNMAIYQRTTDPVFTVTKLEAGQTTDFRVSAYDAKGKVLDSKDFKFASVTLDAPELYKGGNSIDVAVGADASLNYDLSWFYVTESGDVEIAEAKGLTSFTPDAATYPIKIVASPFADAEGLCVGAPVEAIVDPCAPQFGINAPYVTTNRSFVTTWDVVPGATRYAVQKLNASGAWAKMTAFDVVDGQVVGNTRATISEDGTQLSFSVNMAKIGVEETYRVLAIDAKGAVIESGEFAYNPLGLTVENDAYDLANGSQILRADPVQEIYHDELQYQWYYSTNDDPTNWQVVDGATTYELVLSEGEAALNYNYKVLATDPTDGRQSVSYARANTLAEPTILSRTVDANTGELVLTWKADSSLAADNFIVEYYRIDGEYAAWGDLPQGTIVANGDGTFTLTRPNGANFDHLRVRAVNETGWSSWYTAIPEGIVVNTKMDVVDPNDGVTSWREAIDAYQTLAAKGAMPPGLAVTFDATVFRSSTTKISIKNATPIIVVTEHVKIDASNLGYRLQIQSSNSKHDVFHVVGENASLELVSLNLFGANDDEDGAILRAEDGATVKIVDCVFASNRTSQHGGAIALFSGSKLIVEDSLFNKNSAQLGGGVIYAVDGSSVTVKDSTFTNNTAGGDGNGGAVWIDASSTLEVENSTFTPDGGSNLSGNVTTSKGSAIWKDDSVVSAALLDDAFVELEEEIELFF